MQSYPQNTRNESPYLLFAVKVGLFSKAQMEETDEEEEEEFTEHLASEKDPPISPTFAPISPPKNDKIGTISFLKFCSKVCSKVGVG